METLRPAVAWELAGTVAQIAGDGRSISVNGAGSKSTLGRSPYADVEVELTYMRGFNRFEPAERSVSVMAGTLLNDLERDLARAGLMLPFEPVDLGPMLGRAPWLGTIGSVFATNLAGSRRIVAGSLSNLLHGANIVTGRGEMISLGGAQPHIIRQPDMLAALTGSWGTLGIMTQVSFRVAALPEETASIILPELPNEVAVEAMADALLSECGVTGAVHVEPNFANQFASRAVNEIGGAVTVLRLESLSHRLPQRLARLRRRLSAYAPPRLLPDAESVAVWSEVQSLTPFQYSSDPVWRIVLPASHCAAALRDIRRYFQCRALIDWAGGLIWLEVAPSSDAGAADIRRVLANYGGHATLIRADSEIRHSIDCFQPLSLFAESKMAKLKALLDPSGILNAGRLHARH